MIAIQKKESNEKKWWEWIETTVNLCNVLGLLLRFIILFYFILFFLFSTSTFYLLYEVNDDEDHHPPAVVRRTDKKKAGINIEILFEMSFSDERVVYKNQATISLPGF